MVLAAANDHRCNKQSAKYVLAHHCRLSSSAPPDKINNLGLVVNLAEMTVAFAGYVTPIDKADATNISFSGQQKIQYRGMTLKPFTISGDIDRVTGAVNVMMLHEDVGLNTTWKLLCRPATRLF